MSYLSAAVETIGVIKTAVCACENYRGTNAHLAYLGEYAANRKGN